MNLIVQCLLPSIKAFVISRSPTSLDDVKQRAELAEVVSQIDSGEGSVHPVTKCSDPKSVFEMQKIIEGQQQLLHAVLAIAQDRRTEKSAVADKPGRDSRPRGPQCYYCGKFNHIKRNCLAYQRDQQQHRHSPRHLQQPWNSRFHSPSNCSNRYVSGRDQYNQTLQWASHTQHNSEVRPHASSRMSSWGPPSQDKPSHYAFCYPPAPPPQFPHSLYEPSYPQSPYNGAWRPPLDFMRPAPTAQDIRAQDTSQHHEYSTAPRSSRSPKNATPRRI